jgi:hypothetical protein
MGGVSTEEPAKPERRRRDGHPVIWGLVSLVAVTLVVGGILAGGALVGTQALGLSDDTRATAETTVEETLYAPEPTDTGGTPSSYITFSDIPEPDQPTYSPNEPEFLITLSAGQTEVGPMEPIDLTGTYPGGDGAILRVQQFRDGVWDDFPVTAPVNGEQFYTFIQASAIGPNRFRMIDTDTGEASNEVRVQIG